MIFIIGQGERMDIDMLRRFAPQYTGLFRGGAGMRLVDE